MCRDGICKGRHRVNDGPQVHPEGALAHQREHSELPVLIQLVDLPLIPLTIKAKANSALRARRFHWRPSLLLLSENLLPSYCSLILIYDFTDSGHGHQVPCSHYTEPDGLDEGKLF